MRRKTEREKKTSTDLGALPEGEGGRRKKVPERGSLGRKW